MIQFFISKDLIDCFGYKQAFRIAEKEYEFDETKPYCIIEDKIHERFFVMQY